MSVCARACSCVFFYFILLIYYDFIEIFPPFQLHFAVGRKFPLAAAAPRFRFIFNLFVVAKIAAGRFAQE